MDSISIRIYWEDKALEAEKVLSEYAQDYQRYKDKYDENGAFAKILINRLAAFRQYMQFTERLIISMEQEMKEAYQEGFQEGSRQTEPINDVVKELRLQKRFEAAREYTISRARTTWPELF